MAIPLAGCANGLDAIGHPFRIDPHVVTSYKGNEDRLYHDATEPCPYTRPIDDTNYGAIDLDCFKFPEDTQDNGEHGEKGNVEAASTIQQATLTRQTTTTRLTEGPAATVLAPGPAASSSGKTGAGPLSAPEALSQAPHSAPTSVIRTEEVTRSIQTLAAPTAYALAAGLNTTARNRLASILITQSNDICALEMAKFEGTTDFINFGSDALISGFAGAATIVSGNLAKSILSGVAAFTSATKGNFNSDFLRNQISQAIMQAIRIERERQLALIEANYSKPTSQWSIDDAIRDINSYHEVCSFTRGMELVLEAVQKGKISPAGESGGSASGAASNMLAEVRLEYLKIDGELHATTDKTERAALLTERQKLQEIIDGLLNPAPTPAAAPSITLITMPPTNLNATTAPATPSPSPTADAKTKTPSNSAQ